MPKIRLSSLFITMAVLAVLMACGMTWYARFETQWIDETPIAWGRFSPEAVRRELAAGNNVIVLLNFPGIMSAAVAERECVDTVPIRRMVARGEVTPLRLRLGDERSVEGDLSRALWKKYGLFPAPAVLIYRRDRPDAEPWLLRDPFTDVEVVETLLAK